MTADQRQPSSFQPLHVCGAMRNVYTHLRMQGRCRDSMSTDPTISPRQLRIWRVEKSKFQIIPNQSFLLIMYHWYLLVHGGGKTIYSSQIPSDWRVMSDISACRGSILKVLRCNIIYKNKAGYTAQNAPSTRLKITRDRRTDWRTDGPTDRRTDGHNLI